MRSLLIVSLSILSSFSYSMTCGSSLKKIDSVVTAYANCASCFTMNDFAMAGASMLYDNGGFRNVILSRAANKALVTLRGSYRSTPISFGMFGFSWNIRATNYAERLVTAIPMGGSVPGSPWSDQKTHVSALKAKCDQIEKEKAAMETASDLAREAGHVNRGLFVGIQGVSTSYLQGLIDSGNVATNAVNVYWEQVYDIGGHH